MGQSTDAILVYGIPLREDFDKHENGFPWGAYCFEEWLAEQNGLVPYERNTDKKNYYRNKKILLEKIGIELVDHCHGEEQMHILSVIGGHELASRGDEREVDLAEMAKPHPNWDEKLKEFCIKYNFDYYKPKWYLVAYWH